MNWTEIIKLGGQLAFILIGWTIYCLCALNEIEVPNFLTGILGAITAQFFGLEGYRTVKQIRRLK